jgi:pimeloyl-ACP methyl ester carboxylesterase
MPLNEDAVLFGAGRSLVGILSHPEDFDPARPAVLLLNSGLMHRAGPYRLYVKLARQLASLGFLVLRFDFSGVGDSLLRQDDVPQNRAHLLETREAMDYLEAAWGTRRFLSMGICRGAWASFAAACQDPRLIGLTLINPDTLADDRRSVIRAHLRNRSIVVGALTRLSTWLRVLRRPSRYRAQFAMLIAHLRSPLEHGARLTEADQVAARLGALVVRGVDMLFLFSQRDSGYDYVAAILERGSGAHSERIALEVIPLATHEFLSLASQRSLAAAVERWAARFTCGDPAARKAGDTADR